jgi:hypothetical protein
MKLTIKNPEKLYDLGDVANHIKIYTSITDSAYVWAGVYEPFAKEYVVITLSRNPNQPQGSLPIWSNPPTTVAYAITVASSDGIRGTWLSSGNITPGKIHATIDFLIQNQNPNGSWKAHNII